MPRWVRRLLGVPLLLKIVGANAIIAIAAIVVAFGMHDLSGPGRAIGWLMILALLASLIVNVALVRLALQPIRDVEATAGRVWRGDLEARVRPSLIADRDMTRVGGTINLLLDGLVSDRARMRRLASQVIGAQDAERARIARELHDSTAQMLAAVVLQLGALERDCPDPALAARVDMVKLMATEAMEEVRLLSHTVHPRVLDDLGLGAALEWLGRQTSEASGLPIDVAATEDDRIPPAAASALYRVAQEAIANALKHAGATHVRVLATTNGAVATLEVIDDGHGFDVAEAEVRRAGMGLFAMRERVALVDGHVDITSAPNTGTRVFASVPLAQLN